MTFIKKSIDLALSDVRMKASGGGGYTFEGYASAFGGVDTYGDTVQAGAYAQVIQAAKASGRMPKMFFNHAMSEIPVGRWVSMNEDSYGLVVAGELTKGMTKAEDLRLALAAETLDGLSVTVGLKEEDVEYIGGPNSPARLLIKNVTALREISLVTFPADDKGRVDITSIKAELDSLESLSDLEAFLRENGQFTKSAAKAFIIKSQALLRREVGSGVDAQAEAAKYAAHIRAFSIEPGVIHQP